MKQYRYALVRTGKGIAAVVVNDRGVCGFVWPMESAEQARRAARTFRADAVLVRADRLPMQLARRLRDYFAGRRACFGDVPVDLSALSVFQADVLRAVRAVAYGQTVSYGQLAARCGRPGAARAVGQALAANPVAVIVPCHRVVASDGSLGGFSAAGGVKMKRLLLAMEQQGRPSRCGRRLADRAPRAL